jgi:diguanylate cyclase (GGDEF)-like protein
MKEQDTSGNYTIKTRPGLLSATERSLLRWVEIIIASVLLAVLVYLVFISPANTQNLKDYKILVTIEIAIVFIAILLNQRGKYNSSSILFILAAIIGPWWSAFMDPTVFRGNLFPLVYTAIPILFSSFFSPVHVTAVVGLLQVTGLAMFLHQGGFNLSDGPASLFFFVVFMYAFSLIFNIQNRNNRQTITDQVNELEELAVRDPLTGLNNRRFLFEFLEKEILRLKRENGPLSLLILDIDDFKQLNDICGHSGGDTTIISIAQSLKNHFRESDIISRYGGDEFLIVMSGSDAVNAKERAAELQQMISSGTFDHDCQDARQVTISIGIASFPQHGHTVDALIKSADQALYRAKRKGKNRIESA